jgi:hypothetical protein
MRSIGDKTMAGAASEVYEPLNQYKPVARNIGIVDGPIEYLTTAGVPPSPSSLRSLTAYRRWAQSATCIAQPVPLRPHWRVVAGVSGCDCLGLSARTQACPLAGHRCAFR